MTYIPSPVGHSLSVPTQHFFDKMQLACIATIEGAASQSCAEDVGRLRFMSAGIHVKIYMAHEQRRKEQYAELSVFWLRVMDDGKRLVIATREFLDKYPQARAFARSIRQSAA